MWWEPPSAAGGENGDTNRVTDNYGTVGGGLHNTAGDNAGTTNDAIYATVSGGIGNAARGYGATVGGGNYNGAFGHFATVGGGQRHVASGDYATVPGGYYAKAPLYGQMAYASGDFSVYGDAQASLYVLRNTTDGATSEELYLDGSSQRLTLDSGRTLTFEILVVARSNTGLSAGYHIQGLIENVGGTTSFIGVPTVTTLGEDNPAWNVSVQADNTNDALDVWAYGATDPSIHWVATVRTAEVAY